MSVQDKNSVPNLSNQGSFKMKRSCSSHLSQKKQKKLPNIKQNSQKMGEHTSGISTKQTEHTQKFTKRKGKESLSSEHSYQEQEQQFSTNKKHSEQLKKYSPSDINECLNGDIDHSSINLVNEVSQTEDDLSSSSPVQKDCPYEVLNGLRFYSPKSSYDSALLKSSLEAEDAVASTSTSPTLAPCLLPNSPESKSTSRKTYGRRIGNDHLNSSDHSDESIISSTRHDVLDVPIENPLDVTIEEPSEFDVWIIDDNDLAADVRYIPLNFGVKIEVEEAEVGVEESEGCNINEEVHHSWKSSSVETNVHQGDKSNFVLVDVKTKTIKPLKKAKNVCGTSSTTCYASESSVKFNDIDENNLLFGDVEIEIANTCYSIDDKEPVVHERTILENIDNIYSEKLSDSSVASSRIGTTSVMTNNQETNDSLFVSPSSSKCTKVSALKSRILEVKNDNIGSPATLNDSDISRNDNAESEQLPSTPVSGNNEKNDALLVTPSSSSHIRNSTLRSRLGSRRLGAKKNENPELEIGIQCCSVDGSETSGASANIERISLPSNDDEKDTSLDSMSSSTRLTRKLRSGMKRSKDLEAKINTHCSSDSNEIAATSSGITSLSNTRKSIELEQLSQPLGDSNSIKKTSLALGDSSVFQTPRSNICSRKSTLRSGSSEVNKNEGPGVKILNTSCFSNDSDTSVPFIDITSPSSIKESVEPEQLPESFVASSTIKRSSLEGEDDHLTMSQTLSSNGTRKSTLRSRSSGMNQNEDLVKIAKTNCSHNDSDSSVALDNITTPSNTNDITKSEPLYRSLTTSNSSKRSSLPLHDDSLFQTPGSNTHSRKSTLRSSMKGNEDLEAKIVNTCSSDDADRPASVHDVIAPSSTNGNIELEQNDNEKDDSLFLSPNSSKHTKKSTLRSKLLGVMKSKDTEVAILNDSFTFTSNLNESARKSTLRSKSLEVKKSHNNEDLGRKISSRSLSRIDQGDTFPKENRSLEKCSNMHLKNTCEKLDEAVLLNNDKSESEKKIMNKKILKVLVVPMKNMIMDRKCHDDIQQVEIGPSSSLDVNKTTENNNLPKLILNGMKSSLPSNVEQNCDTDITGTQNPKLRATDEKFVNDDILNRVNQSPSRKNNQKKIDDRTSSDFISPRLKAKQLQQMGLIAEDTSFAFYSTVDSVLAEIKVSQKQHKLSSTDKRQHTGEDERIRGDIHTSNVTKEQSVSVCVRDVITEMIENVAKSSSDQNEDRHGDIRATRNKKSSRKSRPLIQDQDSCQRVNSDCINNQGTFGRLVEDCQNGLICLDNDKTSLDTIANNDLAELDDTETVEKNEQKAVGNMSLEKLNEPEDLEDSNADCINHNKMTSELQESECNIEIQKIGVKQMSPTKRRGRSKKTETLLVTQMIEESTSKKQPLSQESEHLQRSTTVATDNFSPTRKRGRPRVSGISSVGKSEDIIVSNEQQVSQGSEIYSDTDVTENISIKKGRGRPRKSKVFTERLSNINGDGTKHLQESEVSSRTPDKEDKVSTRRKVKNCGIPLGLSNDVTVLKKQDLSQELEVTTEPFKKIPTLSAEDVPTRRRGRSRKSEVSAICESYDEKVKSSPKQLQECKITTGKLKEKLVSPLESKLTVNKKNRTSVAAEKDQVIVTNALQLYQKSDANDAVSKIGKISMINRSPKTRMTRSRSQELVEINDAKPQLHIPNTLVTPQECQVNTEIERNLNNLEQKSIQTSKIEALPSKEASSVHRRSGKLRETQVKKVDSVGINITDSLEDGLKSLKQSETPEKRRGRSRIAESTLITHSSEIESKSIANLSRPQTDIDSNSSVGLAAEALNKKPTCIDTSSMVFEQNNELIRTKGDGEKNLNNHEKKSKQTSKIEALPSKGESSGHRKSRKLRETRVENVDSVGINVSDSLEAMLKSPKQSETPEKRRGRSRMAESTLITHSSEIEPKCTADINRPQTDIDSNNPIGVAAEVLNKKPTSSMVFEQNNELKRANGHGESFDSNRNSENRAKSVEKWVEEHVELVEAVNNSIQNNSESGQISITNDQQISKKKVKTDKACTPRRSLTRGRKLVAMIQDNVSAMKYIQDGDTRNSDHQESVLHTKSVTNTLEAATDFVKPNAEIEQESILYRRLTRGSSSMVEQKKLVKNNTQDENQKKQIEKAKLVVQTEERCDTMIVNDRKETEAKSGENSEENLNRPRRISRRRSCSVLLEKEKSKEDNFEDVMGHRRDSTSSDGSQVGAETDGNAEMMQHSPEKPCRPATSLGNRKKGRRSRSMSWSSRRSRSRSKCPSGSDMSSYKHGDFIWAQIGSYPYWPCMVTYAPDTKEVKKTYNMGRGIRTAYHVQFFGDNGRRAWINVTRTMPFNSSNDLKAMVDRLEAEEGGYNMFYQPFMFKSSRELVNQRLQLAAEEADSLKSKTIEEKQKFFEDVLKKVLEGSASSTRQVSSVPSGKSKRRSEDLNTLPPSKIAKVTEKSGTRRSMRIGSMEEANETMQDEEEDKDEDKEMDKKDTPITPKIVRPALVIPPLEELYSIEAQKALFKRNNLFKGVSRDKVCHFCLEPGDVLRCSAKCSGIYHLECSRLVMNNKIPGKRQTSLKYSPSINSEDEERSESGDVDDNHVQIVTVPSCIYNTPPRKNFPPDFDNLTLAEQIDYKMKEVMRKFESKNVYANESQSASSDDNASEKKVVIKHVAADSVIEEHVTKLKKPAKNHVAVKLFARPEDANENGSFKTPNSSTIKRHVTADDVSFEALATDSKNFKCGFCLMDVEPNCFVCHERISPRGNEVRQKCSLYHCGRFFHPGCLKMWPQTQWSIIQLSKSKNESDSFVCPQHVCHTCVSDDPRAATSRCSCDKIVKCMLCPRSYHSSNLCIPAGTKILSTSQIICPGHRKRSNSLCINTTWCFLCSEGGNLICCENCPTSVHPECLPVNLTDDGKFICEDCESGRLPLYDEIVWVKLGHFRWWPAVILFPNEVPPNVKMVKHSLGDFVVRFFGTYNYYWVNRGRSFLFQDGDTGDGNNKVKKLDKEFKKAVEEATLAHKLKQAFKNTQQVESPNSQKPPPYIKIKVNKPVGNVRQLDLDLSNTTACNCDPNQANPCGPDSDCLNRLLMTECNPEVCPAGSRCRNQSFEKREYPPMVPYKTQARGWGLKTLMPIKKGQFVIEYVGEIIDTEEYQRRIQKMHEQKEENYYFLTIDNQRMLDAGPKGNLARFMNHCCQPNCETQKWTVNGETRVGLFATVDIPAETELTFNYNLECVGKEKKVCRCGAPNCSGFIGVKAKQDDLAKPTKVVKRVYKKKKKVSKPVVFQPCFICSRTGDVITCNNKMCNKAYHKKCLKLDINNFDASRFVCPWHNCDICSKRTIRCCVKCIRSYCPQHSDGKIRHDRTEGFICYKHDPMKRYSIRTKKIDLASAGHSELPVRNRKVNKVPLSTNVKVKRKKAKLNPTPLQYKEALTGASTTDSDSDTPLADRLIKRRSKNMKNNVSPKEKVLRKEIAGISTGADVEAPLAQTLSSAINISKKSLQPQTLQDEASKTEEVPETPENSSTNADDPPLNEEREEHSSRKIGMEEHLAITGSEIEICNLTVTTEDEMKKLSERKTAETEDPTSHDPNIVVSKAIEESHDEAHEGKTTETKVPDSNDTNIVVSKTIEDSHDQFREPENRKGPTKTKAQLKEYPTNIETENSCEVAAALPDKISEQNLQLQDDEALTENHGDQTLSPTSAVQNDSSQENAVDACLPKIVESALDDIICDGSPIENHEANIETNLPKGTNDGTDTSRLCEDTERENSVADLSGYIEDSTSEIDADPSSKLFSDSCTTDDSQDEGEKTHIQKRRKRTSHRLTTRKRRR